MLKSLLAAALAIALSTAPVSASEKPPVKHGITQYYTTTQPEYSSFLACLRGKGYPHTLSRDETRMLRPTARQRYHDAYWSCFHQALEPHPVRVVTDTFCVVDGALRPVEECREE